MRIVSASFFIFLVLPAAALPQSPKDASGYARVRVLRVAAPALEKAETTQFLATDVQGRPWLLRGDSFEVFGLGADEGFDHRLGVLACDHQLAPAYAAAKDPAGQTWVVSSPREVAVCDFSRQESFPDLRWVISSAAYSASGPLVSVTSLGPPPDAADRFKKTVPRVFALTNGRWQPVVSAPIVQFKEKPASAFEMMAAGRAQTETLLCAGQGGALWSASQNSYRLQKLSSSSETPEHEIVVGSGDLQWQKLGKQDQEREWRNRAAQGANRAASPESPAGIARGVVRALVCGRDGYVYLVVSSPEGMALDRFNPSQNTLERVLLEGVTVSSGPMSAALAPDQLWLGGRLAADGIWRIPVETLAVAHWKPVQDATADGKPLF